MKRYLAVIMILLVAYASVAWADEKPIPAPPEMTTGADIKASVKGEAPPIRLRAERVTVDALLVYDEAGKPDKLMLLDKAGNVSMTIKLK